jgi:hypothetical protein
MSFIRISRLSNVAIFIVCLTCLVIDFSFKNWEKQERVIEHDIHWYYSYLPATFIYDDLKLEKSDYRFDDNYYLFWPIYTADGKKVIKTTMGAAIMYSPFFFVAHAYSLLTDYPENGLSEPYKLLLLFSAVFYLFIGLDFIRRILLHFKLSDVHIAITLLLLGIGTNLLTYSSQSAPMTHTYSFSLFALFIYYTIKWYKDYSIKHTIIIGLLLGLISLIRPTNIIIVFFFLFYGISSWEDFKQRLYFFRKECFLLNILALFTILIWVPQLLYWKTVTGDYFFYSYTDERFFFGHPRIIDGLFSFRKGWLVYTPIMAFSLLGLFVKNQALKKIKFSIILFFLVNVYIIFSWWCWWYGGTFGQRSLIEGYALLAIPLAFFVQFVFQKPKLVIAAFFFICGFFIWLNIFQTVQFEKLVLHWEGMTKELYFKQFGKLDKIPDYDKYISWPNYEAAKNGMSEKEESIPVTAIDVPEKKIIIDHRGNSEKKREMINIIASNGQYLSSDEGAGFNILANREKPNTWETFNLISLGNNEYVLLNHKNLFFSVELNQEKELTANRDLVGSWEIFTLIELNNNEVAFKASNQKYLRFDEKTKRVLATSDSVGKHETFKLIKF